MKKENSLNQSFDRGKKNLRRALKRNLDCKRCGLTDKFVLHGWTCFLLFDSFSKYIAIKTNVFGHYSMNSGIMSIYSTIYMSLAIAALYLWFLFDHTDVAFKLIWLVRIIAFTLYAAILCYSLDAMLFVLDKRMFCQM